MLRVLTDYQAFIMQKVGGVSRYHAMIAQAINKRSSDIRCDIMAVGVNNAYLNGRTSIGKQLYHLKLKKIIEYYNQLGVLSNAGKYDILHPSFYNPYFFKAKRLPPYVITIHDMISELYFPEGREMQVRNKAKCLRNASAIITISEATKEDLLKVYDIPESRISVIYHGYPVNFLGIKHETDFHPEKDYILFVGARKVYKNFDFFLRACAPVLRSSDLSLRVIGPDPTDAESGLMESLYISHRVQFVNDVSDDSLFNEYRNALCFVFPSKIEGFGLPILEAFAAGCPVICTDIPVFREIAGDAALYFQDREMESLSSLVAQIYNNRRLGDSLILKGYERLKRFDWDVTASKTIEVYKSLL